MLVTQSNARKIIKEFYGENFKFRLTTSCTVGVRPVYETELGCRTLAWRKLCADHRGDVPSMVHIGVMLPNGSINWNWDWD